jgi:hypothetical protein
MKMVEEKELSKVEKFFFDLAATILMIGIFLLLGYLYIWLVRPMWGEEKSTNIFTFVFLLPMLLVSHMLANLIIKKLVLPRYLRR